jgi:hypothetical protein
LWTDGRDQEPVHVDAVIVEQSLERRKLHPRVRTLGRGRA